MSSLRADLRKARRVVVKVGSRSLASDVEAPRRLAQSISDLTNKQRRFVLVTSGAIAIGCGRLGYPSRPREMARLQAAAAAGQGVLMRRYDEAFGALGLTIAQVLLTHGDFADRERLNNAREALGALLDAGAVPVINENDTVATDEIRFGDNDQLAAMVTPIVGAEVLVLLTDVDGVLDKNGERISVLDEHAELPPLSIVPTEASVGTGGMSSKLDAARKACHAGANVVIAPAKRPDVLARIFDGEDVGTLCPRVGSPLQARKHWIAYALRPKGTLVLDTGAVDALEKRQSSLLPVGIVGVRGQFNAGDSVRLVNLTGNEVGRGLARFGTLDIARAAGKRGDDVESLLLPGGDSVVVHKDDLVLTGWSPTPAKHVSERA